VLVDGFYGLIGDEAATVVALGATVAAGALLWVLAARPSVSPAAGAAVLALYASAVLVVDVASGPGVDGTGVLLLAAAGTLAVGGGVVRHGLAIALLVTAVGVIPVAAVGLILLLGAMAAPGALLHRLPREARVAIGFGAVGPPRRSPSHSPGPPSPPRCRRSCPPFSRSGGCSSPGCCGGG